ncbi:MAG: DUF362 domain-containing protein [Methanosarcinales archaeon]
MKSPKVALVKGNNRKENIKKALDLIKEEINLKDKETILIKPNLTALTNIYANTNVETVETIIEFLNEFCEEDKKIIIGEGSGSAFYTKKSTWDVFKEFKYNRLEKKYSNVSLVNFDEKSDYFTLPVETIRGFDKIKVLKPNYDYIISVAIPKTHDYAIATFSMKNMMGLIKPSDRIKIHGLYLDYNIGSNPLINLIPNSIKLFAFQHLQFLLALVRNKDNYKKCVKLIHKNLFALFKKVLPDLSVIDGFFGMEGNGPTSGNGIKHGIAIASTDPVKADALSAKIMGFNPEDIGYLYYCKKFGKSIELDNIVGASIKEVQKHYIPHRDYKYQKNWKE